MSVKSTKKRFLAIVLAFLMVLGSVALPAEADTLSEIETTTAAIEEELSGEDLLDDANLFESESESESSAESSLEESSSEESSPEEISSEETSSEETSSEETSTEEISTEMESSESSEAESSSETETSSVEESSAASESESSIAETETEESSVEESSAEETLVEETSSEAAYTDIFTSEWYKNGYAHGLYRNHNLDSTVGYKFQNETISNIILMSEDPILLANGWNLTAFFSGTIFEEIDIDTLKQLQAEGINDLGYFLESSFYAMNNSYTLSATGSTEYLNFSMPLYDHEHGRLYQLQLGDHTVYCINYGKHSPKGTTYTKQTIDDYLTTSQQEVLSQCFFFWLYCWDREYGGSSIKWGTDTAFKKIEPDSMTYLFMQISTWAAMKNCDFLGCIDAVRDTVLSWDSANTWGDSYYNWAVTYKNQGKLNTYKVNMGVYSSGNSANQNMLVFDHGTITVVREETGATKSKVSLTKSDNLGNKLTNAGFTLYEWNGSSYKTVETLTHKGSGVYESGIVIDITTTNKGKYRIAETTVPTGYVDSGQYIDFNIAEEYVKFCYETFLGRSADASGLASWTSQLTSGTSEQAVMRGIATSTEAASYLNTNNKYTKVLYDTLLLRTPTTDNYTYWNNMLTDGTYTRATMFDFFWNHASHYDTILAGTTARLSLSYTMSNTKQGKIKVTKTSANTTITSGNSNYALTSAKYGVYSDSTCKTLVTTLTTNSSGVATSGWLNPGTYYVKEITASKGFNLDVTAHKTTVKTNATASVSSSEPPITGSIKVVKTPTVDVGISLAGAVYGVYSNSACTTQVTTITVNASGVGTATGLALGTYYVKEKTAPAGYELDTKVYTAKCNSATVVTVNSSDPPSSGYGYMVKKSSDSSVSGNSNYSLVGAVYGLYSDAGCTTQVATWTTSTNGVSNTLTLTPGTYYVKEITAPPGFKLSTSTTSITIKAGETSYITVEDVPIIPTLNLTKTSSDSASLSLSDYALSGAIFGVYSDAACTSQVTTMTTDANGKASTTLLGGYGTNTITYYVKEITAPKGYKLDTTVHTVQMKQSSATSLTVTDDPIKGTFELIKTSSDTASLNNSNYSVAGAEFGVYSDAACTSLLTTMTTDAAGKASTTLLGGYGSNNITYYVKEIKAPKGYELDTTVYPVAMRQGEKTSQTVTDDPIKGTFNLVKTSSNSVTLTNSNYSLEGAIYGVYTDSACNNQVTTMTTDANGNASVNLLGGYGTGTMTYYVKEITAPKGYALDPTVHTVTITQSKTTSKNVSDTPLLGTLSLTKTSSNSISLTSSHYSLEGAEYGIFSDAACNTQVTTVTTDANGKASVSLPAGYGTASMTYYVKEIKAPKGYNLNPTVSTITLKQSQTTPLSVTDDPILPTLNLSKTSSNTATLTNSNYSLQGAVYGVYSDAACNSQVTTMTTDADGKASVILPGGYGTTVTYYVKEITAPTGYKLDTTVYPVSMKQGTDSPLNVVDDPKLGTAYIEKQNSDVEYTGTSPQYSLLNASFGIYATKAEAEAATAGNPGSPLHTFITTIEVKDSSHPEYVAYKAESERVELLAGTYYVKELQAPKNFKENTNVYQVAVSVDEVKKIEIINDPKPYDVTLTNELSISIVKKNRTGDVLPGATFTIEYFNNTLGVWIDPYTLDTTGNSSSLSNIVTTGNDGSAVFEKLPVGKYRITETAAPAGYSLLAEPVIVDLPVKVSTILSPGGADFTQDGNDYWLTYEMTVQDGQLIEMPFTGGVGVFLPVVGGTVLTFIGGSLIRRKKENE